MTPPESTREQQLAQATNDHQQGNFQAAESLYRQLLDSQQDDNVGYLLGTLLLQKGDAALAVEHLKPIAERHPESTDLHNNLGVAYQTLNQRQEAVKAFQASLKADQNYPQGWQNLGKLLFEMKHVREAEKCYREAVRLLPEDLACRQDWIQALISTEQWTEAAQEIETLLQKDLSSEIEMEWKTQAAFVQAQLHNYVEATRLSEEVQARQPENISILANLSYLYEHIGEIDKAIAAGLEAQDKAPHSAEIANNLGVAYRSAHRMEEALSAFSKSIELNPDLPLATFNRGSTLLLTENYQAGWVDYERRLSLIPQPEELNGLNRWTGEKISGRKLLIVCDQGFGDLLMFARFLPLIRERSDAVTIFRAPPEMLRLLNASRLDGLPLADIIVSEDEPLPQADCMFPLMSAAAQLGLGIDDVGMQNSYLQPPRNQPIADWLESSSVKGQKTIGLCWRGNAAQAQDHVRTMSLETLFPLSEIPDIRWVSLQMDADVDELKTWPGEIISAKEKVKDFADTAAILQEIDLLITVDTAICHLAGAMQRPVWNMLPHTPDWRWHLNREDSPWYPSMQLYRQPRWGDWKAVVKKIAAELN
ncbi:tetratricopeptide repeat protein [uncultured Rubinisphaera sp.]|uniref:tetratricopeptide repeat protein n=1 Tax=uncultured Rubinisphaera sp. TaxID=1678686 RepID=UPI0030DAABE3